MPSDDPIVLLSESRLKTLLEEATERAARRILRAATDPAAGERPGKEWLTNVEAMEYLGLSRPTLARYRAAGKLPYSKPVGGSNVYYRLEDVKALLEASAVERETVT